MQPEHQTPLAVTGPLARVLALQHLNSVCRGSIVSRASRTLTAFGVSAGVLAQGQFNHSTPLRRLASTFAGENVSAVFLAGQYTRCFAATLTQHAGQRSPHSVSIEEGPLRRAFL